MHRREAQSKSYATAPFLAITVAFLSACNAAGSSPASLPAEATLAQRSHAVAEPSYAHKTLYVSDFGTSSIQEFPIVHGRPVGKPSNSITGVSGPISIAFDREGNLYVAESSTIEVFKPGASHHAKPKRTLTVPQGPYAIAVDSNDYLYVDGGFSDVYVYAPGAKGNQAPLFDINNFPGGQVESIAIAPSGDLYLASWAVNGALVYSTPESSPTLKGEFVDASLAGPIGISFDNNEMYVVDSGNSAVKAYSTFIGTVSPDRVITSISPPMSSPTDIDAFKGSLFVTNPAPSGSGPTAIFQLNPLQGPQQPKSVLIGSQRSGFSNAQDAQLGP